MREKGEQLTACGIVAEYNPFHNGHLLHMNQARAKSGADVIVVVMSGNFLQRGEPALVDKWKRTAMALAGGADLVVELPTVFAVQPADFFAKGAVATLQALNCSSMSFGTENGTDKDFEQAGRWYHEHATHIDAYMKKTKNSGASYPVQMAQAMESLSPSFIFDLSSPNNQLGFAYARENASYPHPMALHTVLRKGSQYHDTKLGDGAIASATAIRQALFDSADECALDSVSSFIPPSTFHLLQHASLAGWEDFWTLLQYQLTVRPTEELRNIYQMSEGIEHRLKKEAFESRSFHEFVTRVKTKRYTWTRLQRLAVYTLLQLTDDAVKDEFSSLRAVRVLGFTPKGQQYLNQQKSQMTVPLITNINKKNQTLVKTDILSGKVYRLPQFDKVETQDFFRQPIRYS